MKRKSKRPILWIGGTGLPRGTVGRDLASLGHRLRWEPISHKTIPRLAELDPVLIIVEASRMTAKVRQLLVSLQELRDSRDFIVFLLRDHRSKRDFDLLDGCLVKGRGLVPQISAALDAATAVKEFKAETSKVHRHLKRAKRELGRLRNLVVRDDLTCLYNLRFFNRSLDAEHSRAMRFRRQYSVIFMDLDGLREVNSRYGHLAGGRVLKQLGEYLNNSLRRIDIPARVGGDEFVVICPETSKVSARMLADRLRKDIESMRIHSEGENPGITASMGVASFPEDGDSPDKVLERADRALYEAKARGKNVVCSWGDFPATRKSKKLVGSVHNKRAAKDSEEEETDPSEIETLTSS